MIIFYHKQSGEIQGTIQGRIHGEDHLQMWLGDKEEIERLVVQWKPNEDGVHAPDHEQQELIKDLEANPTKLYEYQIKNDMLVKK